MGDTTLLKEMGQRILARRRALKLTQEELADKLGVSTQMISNLELGKKAIRPENLVKLCEVLDLSADFILTGGAANNTVDDLSEKLAGLSPEELQILLNLVGYMQSRK